MINIHPLIMSAALLLIPLQASSQDFDAMIQQQLQQGQAMAGQMQQMEQGIVQQNMQNPQVQQSYQAYVNNGGTMSYQQFAYQWAATAGFSPDGMARYNQNERNIQQREGQAIQQYRQNQANNYQAMQDMHQRNAEIARHRGNTLQGTTDYVDPSTGIQHNLPHNVQPNTYMQDPNGQGYYNDPQGNYYRGDGNGNWFGLEEDE